MKIKVKNLGVLKQAEFTLGNLTILCGCNNTGKTYATYALFGFLSVWKQMFSIEISNDKIDQLLADGVIHLDIQEYVKQFDEMIIKACQNYTQQLPKIFATSTECFRNTEFQVETNINNITFRQKFERTIGSINTEMFSISKREDSTELIVTLLLADTENRTFYHDSLKRIIDGVLKNIIFLPIFPRPFIASAERTGISIFRKDLNFQRDIALEEISQATDNINTIELLLKDYKDYPLPIKKNVYFIQKLETLTKKSSFIAENHPDILIDFADIIGGKYTVTSNDELYYVPKGKQIKLSMDESSSAVRSLLDISFYLRHEAQPGDLLMVDEPELNLHPENQRRIARLFARLVNLGIKVFITTHSDYIVKELNTLIMLNHDKPHLKRIAEQEGYRPEELISYDQVKVYIAEKAFIKLDGSQKKTKCQTLTSADINPELGIDARSFDPTIETMNRIQESIVWGAE